MLSEVVYDSSVLVFSTAKWTMALLFYLAMELIPHIFILFFKSWRYTGILMTNPAQKVSLFGINILSSVLRAEARLALW
jgi:hypothetical protein